MKKPHRSNGSLPFNLPPRRAVRHSKFGRSMSALIPIVLQNYFEGVARATLIQDQTKTSNVDWPRRPIGFDYCANALQQRVLQHIHP